ncbi:MAG TPA: RNA polymerase sigma factor [Vicinamibacteria bacterium]|nr:RNA polymerase sigma factor [Vicinamibacteria bacterium]
MKGEKGRELKRARLLRFRESEDEKPGNGRSDDDIMLSVTTDVSELRLLFERHHRALFGFFFRVSGNRTASEDLVQDVFFRILKYRHTYRAGIPFTRWMYRIAINARRDQMRKHQCQEVLDGLAHDPPGPGPIPDEELSKQQELVRLRESLLRLAEPKREVLVLSRYQNLKYDEIGAILGVSPGTVKVRVYRALQELRELFFESSGEERT